MALTQENLLVEVGVDSKPAVENFGKIEKSIEETDAELEKVIKSLDKTGMAAAATSKTFNQAMVTAEKSAINFGKASDQAAKSAHALQKSMGHSAAGAKDLNKEVSTLGSAFKAFEGFTGTSVKGILAMTEAISAAIQGFNAFLEVIDKLTDPQNLRRLANVLTLLQLMARLKGHRELSDSLGRASEKMMAFSDTMQDIRDNSMSLGQLAKKAQLLTAALEALDLAGEVAYASLIALITAGVIRGFNEMAKALKLNVDFARLLFTAGRNARKVFDKFPSMFKAFVFGANAVKNMREEIDILGSLFKFVAKPFKALSVAMETFAPVQRAVSNIFKSLYKGLELFRRGSTVGAQRISLLTKTTMALRMAMDSLGESLGRAVISVSRAAARNFLRLSQVFDGLARSTAVFASAFRQAFNVRTTIIPVKILADVTDDVVMGVDAMIKRLTVFQRLMNAFSSASIHAAYAFSESFGASFISASVKAQDFSKALTSAITAPMKAVYTAGQTMGKTFSKGFGFGFKSLKIDTFGGQDYFPRQLYERDLPTRLARGLKFAFQDTAKLVDNYFGGNLQAAMANSTQHILAFGRFGRTALMELAIVTAKTGATLKALAPTLLGLSAIMIQFTMPLSMQILLFPQLTKILLLFANTLHDQMAAMKILSKVFLEDLNRAVNSAIGSFVRLGKYMAMAGRNMLGMRDTAAASAKSLIVFNESRKIFIDFTKATKFAHMAIDQYGRSIKLLYTLAAALNAPFLIAIGIFRDFDAALHGLPLGYTADVMRVIGEVINSLVNQILDLAASLVNLAKNGFIFLLKTMSKIPDIAVNVGKSLAGIGKVVADLAENFKLAILRFNGFGRASTAGAQRIGSVQKILIDLQMALDNMGKSFAAGVDSTKAFANAFNTKLGPAIKTTKTGLFAFGKGFFQGFTEPLKESGTQIKNAAQWTRALAMTIRTAGMPSMLLMAEAGGMLGSVLTGLGLAFIYSESMVMKFGAGAAIVAGIIFGGFAAAFSLILKLVGSAATAIGTYLIDSMEKFTIKAGEMETVTNNLAHTIAGFTEELGVSAVGAAGMWNSAIEGMAETTIFSQKEISKAVQLLIAEGTALGLSVRDMNKVLAGSADIAANTGKDLNEVIKSVISGLAGNSQAVLALGINIRESALAHTHFVEETGKSVNALTEQEKTMARLEKIMKRAKKSYGAAAEATNTMEGAQKRLDNQLELLQARIGAQNVLVREFLLLKTRLVTVLSNLPGPVMDVVGGLWDFFGVSLKVLGVIASNLLILASLKTVIVALNAVIMKFTIVQNLMSVAAVRAGKALQFEAVAVTNLSTLLINLTRALKAGVVVALIAAAKAIGIVIAKVAVFLAGFAIIAAKILIVVGIIYAFGRAIYEVADELGLFQDTTEKTAKKTKGFSDILARVFTVIKKLARAFIDLIKLALIGLLKIIILLGIAWSSVLKKFNEWFLTGEEASKASQKLTADLGELADMMDVLNKSSTTAAVSVLSVFDETATAAGTAGDDLAKFMLQNVKFRKELHGREGALAALASSSDLAAERAKILGDKWDGLIIGLRQAKKAAKLAGDEFKKTGSDESLKKYKEALAATNRLQAEFTKERRDTLKGLGETLQKMQIDELNNAGSIVEASRMESQIKLDAFDKQAARLAEVLDLREKEKKILADIRKGIKGIADEDEKKAAKAEAKKRGAIFAFDDSQIDKIGGMLGEGTANIASAGSDLLSGGLGVIGAANIVMDAVQGLIDAIPQLLGKMAGILESFTNLPTMIADGVARIGDALVGLVTDFIPNLVNAIGDIVLSIAQIFEKLPEAFIMLFEKLPDIIVNGIIMKLPAIVKSLVKGFIYFFILKIPIIALTIIKFLVRGLPIIVRELIRMMPEIAMAFVAGIVEAFSMVGDLFSSIFSGASLAPLKEEMDKFAKSFTGVGEQLFKVMDIQAAAKASDLNMKIDITLGKFRDLLTRLIKALERLWKWIWEKVLKPFLDALEWVWKAIWQNIIKPFLDLIMKAWTWVAENIVRPLIETLGEIWDFVVENVVRPLITSLKAIWEFVDEYIVGPLVDGLWSVWEWVDEKIVQPLGSVGVKIWEGMQDVFKMESWKNLGTSIWEGLKASFAQAGSIFRGLGTKMWDGLKAGLDGLSGFFTNLFNGLDPSSILKKIFTDPGGGPGKLEGILGINVPVVSFAGGGILGGNAAVSGDSEMNDRILALLSPGEAIIPRSKMDDPRVRAVVSSIIDGSRNIEKYSMGSEFVKDLAGELESWSMDDLQDAISRSDIANIDFTQLDPRNLAMSDLSVDNAKKFGDKVKGMIKTGAAKAWEFVEHILSQLGLDATIEMFRDLIEHWLAKAVDWMVNNHELGGGKRQGLNIPGYSTIGFDPAMAYQPVGTAAVITDPDILANLPSVDLSNLAGMAPVPVPAGFQNDLMNPTGMAALEMAAGGLVGGYGSGDSVPARLQPGEFVVNRAGVNAIGLGALSAANRGQAAGGTVVNQTVNVNVRTEQPIDENFIRGRLIPSVKKELKSASLRGEFIMSPRGLRE